MKKVGAWEASDGERFETRKACERHEAWLEAERFFELSIGASGTASASVAAGELVDKILSDPAPFRAIIRDLIGLTERKPRDAAKPKKGSRSMPPPLSEEDA